jgi:hypothetical protein
MLLLHDLDESASRELAREIINKKCHPVVAARLESITAFTLKNFEQRTVASLPAYVSKNIRHLDSTWRNLQVWLDYVPAQDLVRINRLYIIEREPQDEFWGLYLRFISTITLVWRSHFEWNRLAVLRTEFTLYHEIGHHVDPRDEAPKDSREAFADDYAGRLFRQAHPVLGKSWATVL